MAQNKQIKTKLLYGFLALSVCVFFGLIIFAYVEDKKDNHVRELNSLMQQITETNDLQAQTDLYLELIESAGAGDAQEMLYRSGLPFTGETHLLNHTAGDYLYERYGSEGIVHCKDYFLQSCYHGILIHTIANRGLDGVAVAFDACREKGSHVLTQCAHGVGHGFLAWAGYEDLPDALALCDRAGGAYEEKYGDFPYYYNCYDGVFMENVWAVHAGSTSPDRWAKEDDLFYPCNDERIDSKYLEGCWANQPHLMIQMLNDDPNALETVGEMCLGIEEEYVPTCFDAIARQIHPITRGDAALVFGLCDLMPKEHIAACVLSNSRAYWGIGDRQTSFDICNKWEEEGDRNTCYRELLGYIHSYEDENVKTGELCRKIHDPKWRQECLGHK